MWLRTSTSHRLVRNPNMAGASGSNDERTNETVNNENNPRLSLKQMLEPTRSSTPSCFVLPTGSDSFNFKTGVINLLPSFHGLEREREPILSLERI